MLIFTDGVKGKILSALGQHAPERGGALFGPRNSNLITHFIEDTEGQTTSSSYRRSAGLTGRVQAIESGEPVHYRGIAHSHPDGYSASYQLPR